MEQDDRRTLSKLRIPQTDSVNRRETALFGSGQGRGGRQHHPWIDCPALNCTGHCQRQEQESAAHASVQRRCPKKFVVAPSIVQVALPGVVIDEREQRMLRTVAKHDHVKQRRYLPVGDRDIDVFEGNNIAQILGRAVIGAVHMSLLALDVQGERISVNAREGRSLYLGLSFKPLRTRSRWVRAYASKSSGWCLRSSRFQMSAARAGAKTVCGKSTASVRRNSWRAIPRSSTRLRIAIPREMISE